MSVQSDAAKRRNVLVMALRLFLLSLMIPLIVYVSGG